KGVTEQSTVRPGDRDGVCSADGQIPPAPTTTGVGVDLRAPGEREPPYLYRGASSVSITSSISSSLDEHPMHGQGGRRDGQMAPIPKAESITEQPSGIVLAIIPHEGNRLGRHHG